MKKLYGLIMGVIIFGAIQPVAGSVIADHNTVSDFINIPSALFTQVRANLQIYYGHTSHGSQLVTGMDILAIENASLYEKPSINEVRSDLGQSDYGVYEWIGMTQNYLNDHPETDVVIWSWCGQLSYFSEAGVDYYLTTMDQLETDYPHVSFIYMTGHLDGRTSSTLHERNNQIRSYCTTNNKILFDFADIESYDPDGNYYPAESDACNWCETWCASHTCPSCDLCAHSHCFNCYQKGKAFWWLLARIVGWSPTVSAEIDVKGGDPQVSIFDGDTTPSTTDGTDFGGVNVSSGAHIHSFTIENTGSENLTLTGSPTVQITGAHSDDYNVTVSPASPVAPFGNTSFQITFDPLETGLREAVISIINDDPNENPYDFSIHGTGTIPVIGDVDGNGTVDLTDAIFALQICSGNTPSSVYTLADVNGDETLGLEEAIYAIQNDADMR